MSVNVICVLKKIKRLPVGFRSNEHNGY